MKPILIIPAYNESKYISKFLLALLQSVSKDRIVVVDDGSTDKTAEIASSFGVKVITHMTNLGKGATLKTGCDYAFKNLSAESVIVMDGDGQHEVGDIKLFERELGKGAQVVLGVRSLDAKMPLMRVLGNKGLSILLNILFHSYISDIPSGFKAFTKSAYKELRWHSAGYDVEMEIAVRLAKKKIPFVEVPIRTIYHGKDYGFNLIDASLVMLKLPYWIWS